MSQRLERMAPLKVCICDGQPLATIYHWFFEEQTLNSIDRCFCNGHPIASFEILLYFITSPLARANDFNDILLKQICHTIILSNLKISLYFLFIFISSASPWSLHLIMHFSLIENNSSPYQMKSKVRVLTFWSWLYFPILFTLF